MTSQLQIQPLLFVTRSCWTSYLQNPLSQTVREVTRPSSNNILDQVVTSNPALVENVCVQSGISYHNIVTFTLAANPKISVKPLRNRSTSFTKLTNRNWEMQQLNLRQNFSNQIQKEDQWRQTGPWLSTSWTGVCLSLFLPKWAKEGDIFLGLLLLWNARWGREKDYSRRHTLSPQNRNKKGLHIWVHHFK